MTLIKESADKNVKMKGVLTFAARRSITGLALLILGVEFTRPTIPAARVAGIALIGLSVASGTAGLL